MHPKFHVLGIMLLGVVLRVWQFTVIPPGLYVDEAFAGYETYSLLNTQADEWGVRLPVYFISSGSGQSVLYSYLSLPIVWGLGLSVFSVRLLALLAGIITLPLLYITVRCVFGREPALVSLLLIAIMPWHVMVSRWALEANLLPFFLLLGMYVLTRALGKQSSSHWRLFALVPWALGLYTYALAYIAVPGFLILFFLVYRKDIAAHPKSWFGAVALFIVMTFPIFLFIAKNYVFHSNLGIEEFLPLGIPLLPYSRLAHVSSPLTERISQNLLFLINSFQDGEVRNQVVGIPPTFLVLFPLAVVGCFYSVQKLRHGHTNLYFLWLAACLVLFLPFDLVINRINAIFIPMLVVAAYGFTALRAQLANAPNARKLLELGVLALVLIQAIGFVTEYFLEYPTSPDTEIAFFKGFDRAIRTGVGIAEPADRILVTNRIAPPYILTAFHTGYPPEKYQREISYTLESEAIQVKSFGRFYFGVDNLPESSDPVIYVLGKWEDAPCKNPKVSLDTRLWQVGRCASR